VSKADNLPAELLLIIFKLVSDQESRSQAENAMSSVPMFWTLAVIILGSAFVI
jgi:hypothetical protein